MTTYMSPRQAFYDNLPEGEESLLMCGYPQAHKHSHHVSPENDIWAVYVGYVAHPDPGCAMCHGTGEVSDWVPMPFGHGNTRMPSRCECTFVDEDGEL